MSDILQSSSGNSLTEMLMMMHYHHSPT